MRETTHCCAARQAAWGQTVGRRPGDPIVLVRRIHSTALAPAVREAMNALSLGPRPRHLAGYLRAAHACGARRDDDDGPGLDIHPAGTRGAAGSPEKAASVAPSLAGAPAAAGRLDWTNQSVAIRGPPAAE